MSAAHRPAGTITGRPPVPHTAAPPATPPATGADGAPRRRLPRRRRPRRPPVAVVRRCPTPAGSRPCRRPRRDVASWAMRAATPEEIELHAEAGRAAVRAHAPYSRFARRRRAAVAGSDRPVLGVNVENASYGLTCCAERNAAVRRRRGRPPSSRRSPCTPRPASASAVRRLPPGAGRAGARAARRLPPRRRAGRRAAGRAAARAVRAVSGSRIGRGWSRWPGGRTSGSRRWSTGWSASTSWRSPRRPQTTRRRALGAVSRRRMRSWCWSTCRGSRSRSTASPSGCSARSTRRWPTPTRALLMLDGTEADRRRRPLHRRARAAARRARPA